MSQADVNAIVSLRKRDKGLRELERVCGVIAVLGFSAALASVAHAQGSEPRLLIPAPGSPVPPAPVQGGAVPPQGALPEAPQSVSPPPPSTATPATARLEVRMTQLEQDLRTVTGR